MSRTKFFERTAVGAALFLAVASGSCFAGGGPQVLPNFVSDRPLVKNPVPKDRVLHGSSSDPFEAANRAAWTFNYDYLDRYGLRPVAHSYVDYVPKPIVTGVHNFLSNIREVNNTVNNLAVAEFTDYSPRHGAETHDFRHGAGKMGRKQRSVHADPFCHHADSEKYCRDSGG